MCFLVFYRSRRRKRPKLRRRKKPRRKKVEKGERGIEKIEEMKMEVKMIMTENLAVLLIKLEEIVTAEEIKGALGPGI